MSARAPLALAVLALALVGGPGGVAAPVASAGAAAEPRPAQADDERRAADRARAQARRLQGPPVTFDVGPGGKSGAGGGGGQGSGTAPPAGGGPGAPPGGQSTGPDDPERAPDAPRRPPSWLLWGALAVVVLLLVGLGAWIWRRRSPADPDGIDDRADEKPGARERLLRAAAEAEARGDHAAAVRLRFRAGVLGLRADGALAAGAVTAQDVGRAAPAAAGLVDDLEAVAYAGRTGTPAASRAAREDWPHVRGGDAAAAPGGAVPDGSDR